MKQRMSNAVRCLYLDWKLSFPFISVVNVKVTNDLEWRVQTISKTYERKIARGEMAVNEHARLPRLKGKKLFVAP